MYKKALGVTLLAAALAMPAAAQDKPAAKKTDAAKAKLPTCPVSGNPVDFTVSVKSDDGPVYFCCERCVAKFKKDPDKFAKTVAKQRAMLAKMDRVQVVCPISGEPINPKTFAEVGGKKIYTCCNNCAGKYTKDPTKYAAGLAAAYTYQTKCPVSGNPIDPTAFVELEGGQKVYFCCHDCPKKFVKEPAKYVANLEKQGYPISADKVKVAKPQKP